jgi:hypothetical protein
MAWRLAGSLVVLRNQIDAMAPNRSRASDGTIGDASHSSRCSRHNPNGADVVTALDITHDPAGGCDIHAIADQIRRSPHPELSYLISAGRIAGRTTGWAWHRYTGSNPHNVHVHFGVGEGSDCNPQQPYDSPLPWALEDDMNIAELRAELTTPGTPTRDAIRQLAQEGVREAVTSGGDPTRHEVLALARQGTRSALISKGDPARTAVLELAQRGTREALTSPGDPARTAIVELVRKAIAEDPETRAALVELIRDASS